MDGSTPWAVCASLGFLLSLTNALLRKVAKPRKLHARCNRARMMIRVCDCPCLFVCRLLWAPPPTSSRKGDRPAPEGRLLIRKTAEHLATCPKRLGPIRLSPSSPLSRPRGDGVDNTDSRLRRSVWVCHDASQTWFERGGSTACLGCRDHMAAMASFVRLNQRLLRVAANLPLREARQTEPAPPIASGRRDLCSNGSGASIVLVRDHVRPTSYLIILSNRAAPILMTFVLPY